MSTYYTPPNAITPPSLTSDELALLVSPSATEHYLSVVPSTGSTIVATCRAHGAPVAETVEHFGYYDTSSNFAQVKAGMTIWIGSAAGGNDVGIFRLRKDPDGTNLYIAFMGASDTGLGAIRLKYFYIEEGAYVTVWLLDENLWSAMPRIDYVSPTSYTIYEDYDKAYDGSTAAPEMVLCPGPHQAKWVDDTGYATFTFTPKAYPFVLTSTVPETFTWTLPSAATLISGNLTYTYSGGLVSGAIDQLDITFKLPPGFYAIKMAGTVLGYGTGNPYAGTTRTAEAWRYLWVHDLVIFPTMPISAINSDERDPTGRRVSLDIPGTALGNWRELSIVHYWQIATWNGQTIDSASTGFTGWIPHNESLADAVDNGALTATVDIVGPAEMLDMLPATSHELDWPADGTTYGASTWTEVMATYCTPEFMVWYILRNRAANYLKLFDFYSFALWTNVFDFTTPGVIVERGTLFNQLRTVLERVQLEIGCDSAGALWIRQDPSLIKYPDREDNAIVRQRATLNETMISIADFPKDMFAKRRRVIAEGFYRDGTTIIPVKSAAPDLVNSQGIQEENLQRLLVLSQFHINGLSGLYAARMNNPFPDMQVTLPGNWNVFEPAHWSWVTISLPSYAYARGATFFRRGAITNMQLMTLENGAMETRLTVRAETIGRDGETVLVGDKIPPPPPGGDGAWTITIDFRLSDYGFTVGGGHGSPSWVAGTGWVADTDNVWASVIADLTEMDNTTLFKTWSMMYETNGTDWTGPFNNHLQIIVDNEPPPYLVQEAPLHNTIATSSGTCSKTYDFSVPTGHTISFILEGASDGATYTRQIQVILSGTGKRPKIGTAP